MSIIAVTTADLVGGIVLILIGVVGLAIFITAERNADAPDDME